MMKIDFICRSRDISVGTYRILVKDLSEVLLSKGHDVQMHHSPSTTRDDAVLIYSKGDVGLHDPNDKRKCGAISLSGDSRQRFDFSIVNSIEEKKSVEHLSQETVIINLVELMYKDSLRKIHSERPEFVVGYHGSYTHLPKLRHGFVEAFNFMISNGLPIRLRCMTNDSRMSMDILKNAGMPMDRVDLKDWQYDIAKEYIAQSDVGILPNLTTTEFTKFNTVEGTYNTDYSYRFKNKSNPGRSFVFIQLGIPVITDLTPSMMPIYYDETAGAVATNAFTWVKALHRFMDPQERNSAAGIAYDRFRRLYDMEKDADTLVKAIERIRK